MVSLTQRAFEGYLITDAERLLHLHIFLQVKVSENLSYTDEVATSQNVRNI